MARYSGRTLIEQPSVTTWGQPAPAGIGVVAGYGVATGGTSSSITIGGLSYTLLTFTVDGTLTVTTAGLFDYLVIGSGAGTSRPFNGGGGGGGGQLVEGTAYFDANQTVTVGAGGAVNALNVGISRIGTRIFAMCGGGAADIGSSSKYGASGGATTGGSLYGRGQPFLSGVTGYQGGQGSTTAPNYAGGGGGGMGGAGTDASGGTAGSAGAGVSNSFNGVATTYCRGGFGGIASGAGGQNAASNTGNGGAESIGNYGAGGSGLVMVRFRI